MERKIGEIFECNGEWYQCVEADNNDCIGCDLAEPCSYSKEVAQNAGFCSNELRNDGKSVIFKKLEKVGEPYPKFIFDRGNIKVQRYELYCPTNTNICNGIWIYHWNENLVDIEIKQNKQDMEKEKLSNLGSTGKKLKEFNLEAAKAGKPVCTRDGRKARIICFDYAGETGDYPIVALVSYDKGNNCYERVLKYTSDGLFNKYGDYKHDDDLMMLPEKKEGWVNVYYNKIDGITFSKHPHTSKEEAIKEAGGTLSGRIDTVKISWEE